MRAEEVLSHSRLCEFLSYNADTGIFTWRVSRNSHGGKVKPGNVAGIIDTHGHRIIGIDRRRYMAHRLAWFYSFCTWPSGEIDHINMARDDNRLCNLRVVTKTLQRANQRVRRDSISGLKGVQQTRAGTWKARITMHGVCYRLGTFKTSIEAHAAYAAAAFIFFGDNARAA